MTALSGGALTLIAFITVAIGVATWVKSKGSISKSIMATLGGAFLSTLLVYPQFITAQIPALFKKAMDWLLSVF